VGGSVEAATRRVLQAVLHALSHDYDGTPEAYSDDDAQYAAEQVALAARGLMEAVDALPAAARPAGWNPRRRKRQLPSVLAAAAEGLREAWGMGRYNAYLSDVKTSALHVMAVDNGDGHGPEEAFDRLALACKHLAVLVDSLPPDRLPVGWLEKRRR
jgi:hypothetical protein